MGPWLLTGYFSNNVQRLRGRTTKDVDTDVALELGLGRGHPLDLAGLASKHLLAGIRVGDDIKAIGLGEDGGRKSEDGGDGETHLDGYIELVT